MTFATTLNVVRIQNGWLAVPVTETRGAMLDWEGVMYAKTGQELGELITAFHALRRLQGESNAKVDPTQT